MPTITLKKIPDELYERLRTAAKANRRSINNQVLTYLEEALMSTRVDPEELLARIREVQFIPPEPLTDEFLRAAKDEGRP